MSTATLIHETLAQGEGILQLIPVFVPRRFGLAGRRLRLHPDDYYALGTKRGAIKERWFASVIAAMNGPLAAPDEGMSYVVPASGRRADAFTLRAAVEALGAELIGADLQQRYGNSDVNSVYENVTAGEVYDYGFLAENCPADRQRDVDYILSLMDWDANVDPHYKQHYFRPPVTCPHSDERHVEKWISYANEYVGAKELTVQPGAAVTVADGAAYGCIIVQGHGTLGPHAVESATMLRFGQCSADEYFVGASAARTGVTIRNHSRYEPLVMLKHFGPNHPDMPRSMAVTG